ncbi:DUF1846 domain-containing protein [Eubacteriales bacterium OttesenSCG-928-N13]|nr:DUF1846 domain-containing protein [Eubacteriales bacterium OttesenSCG-928-N13]
MGTGFDHEKYVSMQSEHIRERFERFGGKLYLEFGGKLFDDYHASRVLPGFQPDSKVQMLRTLKDQAEIVIVINAADIEKNKLRGDLGITYDADLLRLIDSFREIDMLVGSVVLTRYTQQPSADAFKRYLEEQGVAVYLHYPIEGYPSDVEHIVSEQGYGKNEYIKTSRPLVVVTAPGPGSGKMATCLSQLYHEHQRGIRAGYAKFETFPIWNLPLRHPVNIAYEAATADLNDVNMIDSFHLEAYGETAVNYNRDIEIFPVVNEMFNRIWGKSPYQSPTDMGVNMVGQCISDDAIVRRAAEDEIIRRFYQAMCAARQGSVPAVDEVSKLKLLMSQAGITQQNRPVIAAALEREQQTGAPAAAMELPDGTIITGKTSQLLGASSALLLNALKVLGGIPDCVHLISPTIIEPIQHLKLEHMGNKNPRLHTDEVLIALSICAVTDDDAERAMAQIERLKNLEVHSSVILSGVDERVFKNLGVNLTCEPKYQTQNLYHK